MAIILGENRYGKAEVRVVQLTRTGGTHDILDLNVTTQLSGDFAATHLTGDNAMVLPTDTQKNTVFSLARECGPMEPEAFGLFLARHFLREHTHVTRAEVRLEQFAWERIRSNGTPHPRAFQRNDSATRVASVIAQRGACAFSTWVITGIEGLSLLKSSDSEFTGFLRDRHTTLQDATDRVMATRAIARWRHASCDDATLDRIDWATSFNDARNTLLSTFAEHYSLSLQQTMYAMGERVLAQQPSLAEIRLSMPNKHHFVVDLAAFGQTNENQVFFAADRPYGLLEAVVTRDDAPAAPASWPQW